jgi:hypothetical protein
LAEQFRDARGSVSPSAIEHECQACAAVHVEASRDGFHGAER